MNSLDSNAPVLSDFHEDTDADLLTRVRAEFHEMPGLKLTLPAGGTALQPRTRAM